MNKWPKESVGHLDSEKLFPHFSINLLYHLSHRGQDLPDYPAPQNKVCSPTASGAQQHPTFILTPVSAEALL